MTIPADQVHALGRLAQLEVSPDQASKLAQEMSNILALLDQIKAVDTTSVLPMYTPVDQPGPWRADEVRQNFSRAQILDNAPLTDGEHFVVPRIV